MEATIHLDDHLLAEAKSYAERSARSLSQVVEEALREGLKSIIVSQTKPLMSPSKDIHPEVKRITGLAPAGEDAQTSYIAHLAERHQ